MENTFDGILQVCRVCFILFYFVSFSFVSFVSFRCASFVSFRFVATETHQESRRKKHGNFCHCACFYVFPVSNLLINWEQMQGDVTQLQQTQPPTAANKGTNTNSFTIQLPCLLTTRFLSSLRMSLKTKGWSTSAPHVAHKCG